MGPAGDMPGPRPLRPMHSPRSGSEISGRVTGSPQRRQPGAETRTAWRRAEGDHGPWRYRPGCGGSVSGGVVLVFADRDEAGRRLAARLGHLRGEPVVVLGLPRGGVLVASQVARALGAPLDVIVVRKLGVPFQPELGMGAVGEDGVRVINPQIIEAAGVSQNQLAAVQAREQAAVQARAARYRARQPRRPLHGRVAVVVDDGIATGSTARTACQIARALGAARVVLAVPVAPPGWRGRIGADADELACVSTPRGFRAIGQFYARFPQVSDDEVIACLERAAVPPSPAPAGTVR